MYFYIKLAALKVISFCARVFLGIQQRLKKEIAATSYETNNDKVTNTVTSASQNPEEDVSWIKNT